MENFFSGYLSAADYRRKAHENCNKQGNKLVITYLVYVVIMAIVLVIDGATGHSEINADGTVTTTTWFQGVFNLLTSGVFAISFAEINRKVYKNINVDPKDLFYGSNDFGRSFILYILQSIFTFLWSLLFVIPGIIKGIAYSMSYYIANDNKDLSASECIDRSKQMMDGYKWDYFCLMLSYTGWIILSVLTFGILFIWVLPRMEQAKYLFYLRISGLGEKMESKEVEFSEF